MAKFKKPTRGNDNTVPRSAKIRLIKPLNCSWQTAGRALRSVEKACLYGSRYLITNLLARDREAFGCGFFTTEGEFKLPTKVTKKKTKGDDKPRLDIPPVESAENVHYAHIRQQCPHISSSIVSGIIHVVERKYQQQRFQSLLLNTTVPVHKSFPIPIHNQRWRMEKDETGKNPQYILVFTLLSKDAEGFVDNDGKPLTQIRFVLDALRVRGTERKAFDFYASLAPSDSKLRQGIQLVSTVNRGKIKWVVIIPYQREKEINPFIAGRVMEVAPFEKDVFLTCLYATKPIPWVERIEHASVKKFHQRYQRQRRERGAKYRQDTKHGTGPKVASVGHGRNRALKNRELTKKYNNFTSSFNKQRAAHIIRIALRWKCPEIQMINMVKIQASDLVLRNWPYYDLQKLVRQLCEQHKILFTLRDSKLAEAKTRFSEIAHETGAA